MLRIAFFLAYGGACAHFLIPVIGWGWGFAAMTVGSVVLSIVWAAVEGR